MVNELSIDAGEHQVNASLHRGHDPLWPWLVDFEVIHEGEWAHLDTVPLNEINEYGMYREADGAFSLRYYEVDEDTMEEKPGAYVVRMPGAEIGRLLLWAEERLRFKVPVRQRPSALAERSLALA